MKADFTPKQTFNWMVETWNGAKGREGAKARFAKCAERLSSRNHHLEAETLRSQPLDIHSWNPIFRFLRPNSIESISSMVRSLGQNDLGKLRKSVVDPYLDAWRGFVEGLEYFYGDNAVSGDVSHWYCGVMRWFSRVVDGEDLSDEDRREYARAFDRLCQSVDCLPLASKHKERAKTSKGDPNRDKVVAWMAEEHRNRKKRKVKGEVHAPVDGVKWWSWHAVYLAAMEKVDTKGSDIFGCKTEITEESLRRAAAFEEKRMR